MNWDGRLEFSPATYCAKDGHTLDCLEITWGLDREFKGDYFRDHQAVCNTRLEIYSFNADNECCTTDS